MIDRYRKNHRQAQDQSSVPRTARPRQLHAVDGLGGRRAELHGPRACSAGRRPRRRAAEGALLHEGAWPFMRGLARGLPGQLLRDDRCRTTRRRFSFAVGGASSSPSSATLVDFRAPMRLFDHLRQRAAAAAGRRVPGPHSSLPAPTGSVDVVQQQRECRVTAPVAAAASASAPSSAAPGRR